MHVKGRVSAAIEVIEDVLSRHRPASIALADWGRAHRFAGSGDRSAIGNLVYDVLRQRLSAAARMGDAAPRALVLGVLRDGWNMPLDAIAGLADGSEHAPTPLSDAEMAALTPDAPPEMPDHVRANVPDWLWPAFVDAFEDEAVAEGIALADRAPLDLRCNTLKSTAAKVLKALARLDAVPGGLLDIAIRIPAPGPAGRTPNVQSDAAFQRGHFEVQDQGSQLAAALVFAQPGEQVLDYCAGAGGKTLALAAAMGNKGQLFAYDTDRNRLQPIYDRVKRSGAHNIQIRAPGDNALDDLKGRMHRVVVDAPCTGTGVWRRRPDAKWRLTPEALEDRLAEQRAILASARDFVRPGGFLCYITCSILPAENELQVLDFVENNPDFELISAEEVWRQIVGLDGPQPWSADAMTLTMTPATTGTDGFYFAVLVRNG